MEVREVLSQKMIVLILTKNGRLSLSSELDLTVSCPMSFASFPFDEHLCPIEITVSDVDIYLDDLDSSLEGGVSFENRNDTTEQDYKFKVNFTTWLKPNL